MALLLITRSSLAQAWRSRPRRRRRLALSGLHAGEHWTAGL